LLLWLLPLLALLLLLLPLLLLLAAACGGLLLPECPCRSIGLPAEL
jgi:hypothetical protein